MPNAPSGTADAAASMILDLGHLRRQTLGDDALEADLLALFARQARDIVAELMAGGAEVPRRAELLHLLCGSARAIGAWEVGLHAQSLENEARGAATSPLHQRATLPALASAVQEACEAIDRRPAATRR